MLRTNLARTLEERLGDGQGPAHPGLVYARWAPRKEPGKKEREDQWNDWLNWIERSTEPPGYGVAFQRWQRSLAGPGTLTFSVRARTRLLIGHGNPTPTEVGLTLHHTWGVPMLPGSSIKGLLAHYVQCAYGPAPEDSEEERNRREPFRGLERDKGRPVHAPGNVYRRLFGAPGVEGAGLEEARDSQGQIVFHDALCLPGQGSLLARDVLTVHQKTYYNSAGKDGGPNDYDSPNPVAFLTVRPGACFLVALSLQPGAEVEAKGLLERAGRYLEEAFREWGLGGKTSAGYGRLEKKENARGTPDSTLLADFRAWLDQQKEEEVCHAEQLVRMESEWIPQLLGLPVEERIKAANLIGKRIHDKFKTHRDRLVQILSAGD